MTNVDAVSVATGPSYTYTPPVIRKAGKVLLEVLPGLLPGFALILLLRASGYFEYYRLLKFSKPVEEPYMEYAMYVMVWGAVSLLPRKWQSPICVGVLIVVQAVAFVDVSYYRFFKELPSLYLLPSWYQADSTGGSVWNLTQSTDLLLLVPIITFVLLIPLFGRLAREQSRSITAALFILTAGAVWYGATYQALHKVRHEQLQRRFQNKAIGGIFGIHFYHIYDAYEWLRVQVGWEGGREVDEELIRRVTEASRASSAEETPFKGMYEGRDVFFLQLESWQYFALDAEYDGQPVMPFLKGAKDRVFHFQLFDQTHLGRSADGQFLYLNSLHPPAARPLPFSYPNNDYIGLPDLFVQAGYRTFYFEPYHSTFWNAKILAERYGFQEFFFKKDMPPRDPAKDVWSWGLTDFALYRRALEEAQACEQPFFMYVVTVMCHHPYPESANNPVDFPPADKLNMVRRFLRCCAARDLAVEELVKELSKTERGRRTVLVLAGDHDANLPDSEMQRAGYLPYPENESVPFLLGTVEDFLSDSDKGQTLTQPRFLGGQIDVPPTLLHVFSLNMEESVFVGWNLFATQNRGPHHSRLGTWMDQAGRIQEWDESRGPQESDLFRVSEMLLQGDLLAAFRGRKKP